MMFFNSVVVSCCLLYLTKAVIIKFPSPIRRRSLVLTEKNGVDVGESGGESGVSEVLYAKDGFAGMLDDIIGDSLVAIATVTHPASAL